MSNENDGDPSKSQADPLERITTRFPSTNVQTLLPPNPNDQQNDPNNGWTKPRSVYIHEIMSKCIQYRTIHKECAIYYNKLDRRFGFTFMIFSWIVGTFAFLTTAIPSFRSLPFQITLTLLTSAQTLLTTANNFLRYQEFMTKHKLASDRFLEIHREIVEQELSSPNERIQAKKYIEHCGQTFDKVVKSSLEPPESVLKKIKMVKVDPDVSLDNVDTSLGTNASPPILPTPPVISGKDSNGDDIVIDVPQSGTDAYLWKLSTPNFTSDYD